jgi:hypothetical protein
LFLPDQSEVDYGGHEKRKEDKDWDFSSRASVFFRDYDTVIGASGKATGQCLPLKCSRKEVKAEENRKDAAFCS